MQAGFVELNFYIYYRMQGVLLDVLIWCLGPLIDDAREYGLLRLYLAGVTVRACRACLGLRNR